MDFAILGTAVATGLVAGVFWAFSSFVMSGLGRVSPTQGMTVMQSFNVTVIGSGFLVTFGVVALASIALAIVGVATWDRAGAGWLVAGAVVYLVGAIGVTAFCNVPLNDALAALDPASAEGLKLWETYLSRWTAWNHVRTLASAATMIAFVVAFARRR